MKKYFEILKMSPLFNGIPADDLNNMLSCLNAKIIHFSKGQMVFEEGTPAHYVGILLSGEIQIIRDDYYGNRSIMTHIEAGNLFGEVFACSNIETYPVGALATQNSQVMLLDCKRIITSCSNACHFHSKLINNLLSIVARKSMLLNQKIELLSKRTTKEKILSYLLSEAKRHNNNEFTIPFDRQGLADYLEVDRSAMASEISKLVKEGIIETKKSWFKII